MTTATERYRTDPMFKALTDMLELYIGKGDFTPTELREAVILAATNYEYKTKRRAIFGRDRDKP